MKTPRSPDANRSPRRTTDASSIFVLGLLLVLPGVAMSRLAPLVDWRLLFGIPLGFSVFAFFAYRSDKRSAEAGARRTPEATLHLVALLGGWPGAFLAQRVFRHKTSKLSFQGVFWLIVLLHQFAAADSLLGWHYTKDAIGTFRSWIV